MGGSEGITIVGHHYFAQAEGLEIDCCEFRGNKRLANAYLRIIIRTHYLFKM